MPHTDTSNKQATNRTSCHATHTQIPATNRQQIVHPTMPHTQKPAKQRHQIVHYTLLDAHTRKHTPSCQQNVHLAILHADTS